jgi:hypothetical protein
MAQFLSGGPIGPHPTATTGTLTMMITGTITMTITAHTSKQTPSLPSWGSRRGLMLLVGRTPCGCPKTHDVEMSHCGVSGQGRICHRDAMLWRIFGRNTLRPYYLTPDSSTPIWGTMLISIHYFCPKTIGDVFVVLIKMSTFASVSGEKSWYITKHSLLFRA